MPAHSTALIVFVKNPVAGSVKTRLAATVGNQRALSIYHRLSAHTAKVVSRSGLPAWVFYSDTTDTADLWNEIASVKMVQEGADLGERMQHAFDAVLDRYPQAIIIGSDCGTLTAEHLRNATSLLSYTDAAIGPSADGGYYLLALKRGHPDVFSQIAWSTEVVFQHTLQRLLDWKGNFALTETLNDIDTEQDWINLGWSEE